MIVTSAVGLVGATDAPAESGTGVVVERTADGLRYEVSLSPDDAVDGLWVFVGDGRVVETAGFERSDDGRWTRLTWNGRSTARVVVDVDVPRQEPAGEREIAVGEGWTFARVPHVEVQRAVDGRVERSWPLRGATGGVADGRGTVGDRFALVGATESATRSTADGRIRVVAPAGTDPDAAADALAAAAAALDVGDRDEAVLAYAVPGVRGGGQAVPARDEFWVNADEPLGAPASVWFHEYVHTRQSFALADDMRWFREASAEYYAARLSVDLGYADAASARARMQGGPAGTLTRPGTWEGELVPHTRGARVLAALDREIRVASDGRRSLEDVFRRLNRDDEPVDYGRFARATNEVAGRPMDDWLARHVDGTTPVESLEPTSDRRPLGGAPSRPTPGAFLRVSVGLSLLAALPLHRVLRRLDGRDPRAGARPTDGSR